MAFTKVIRRITAAACAAMLSVSSAYACSRVVWTTDSYGVFTARTVDWDHSFDDVLYVNPRGIEMRGAPEGNTAEWTSKYGSVTTSILPYIRNHGYELGDGEIEGINEKGLGAHLLYLEEAQYEEPNSRLAVTSFRWVRYVLDNFATVEEAVAGMENIRIEGNTMGGEELGTHLAIEDATGDSAIFEILKGKLVVHHGKEFNVMTNDPNYDWQITHLNDYIGFGGQKGLPGGIEGSDRFVRLAYFSQYMPQPENNGQAVAYMFSLIRNVAVPFGAPYRGRTDAATYPTWWASVTDLENRVFYFNWVKNPNIVWVDLNQIDFSEGSGIRVADPKDPARVGDISRSFRLVEN